jgi:hypothetical protein
MMTTQHTPGPWEVLYSPYTLQDGSELPAYEVIGDEKICDLNENAPPDVQRANANLIAAAPIMRAALELAIQALNTATRFRVPHLDTDSYAIASICDRAIGEAKGGAP